jgi:hypothetical protein
MHQALLGEGRTAVRKGLDSGVDGAGVPHADADNQALSAPLAQVHEPDEQRLYPAPPTLPGLSPPPPVVGLSYWALTGLMPHSGFATCELKLNRVELVTRLQPLGLQYEEPAILFLEGDPAVQYHIPSNGAPF